MANCASASDVVNMLIESEPQLNFNSASLQIEIEHSRDISTEPLRCPERP